MTAQAEAAYRDDKTVPADNFEEIDIKLSDVVSKILSSLTGRMLLSAMIKSNI